MPRRGSFDLHADIKSPGLIDSKPSVKVNEAHQIGSRKGSGGILNRGTDNQGFQTEETSMSQGQGTSDSQKQKKSTARVTICEEIKVEPSTTKSVVVDVDKAVASVDEDVGGEVALMAANIPSSEARLDDANRLSGHNRQTMASDHMMDQIRSHFLQYADSSERIDFAHFQLALGPQKNSFFADRFFHYIDVNNDGFVDMQELANGASILTHGSPEEQLDFIFQLYDMDGDGYITEEELYRVLTACVLESHMHFSDKNLDILTKALFDEADVDSDGKVTRDELKTLFQNYPDVLEGVTHSAANWLLPDLKENEKAKKKRCCSKNYIKNNKAKFGFYVVFGLLNAVFFFLNAYLYRSSNSWIIFARGCGMCLDFCSALVILLPLRMCLSYLRTTWFGHVLPLDHNVFLHKLVGWVIVWWSVWHTVGHLGNAVILTEQTNLTLVDILFTTKAHIGWIADLAPLTGVILLVIVFAMYIMSLSFVRRSGYFEVFWWSHKLYIPYYVLSVLHATHFYKWVVAACFIFLVETIVSYFYKSRSGFVIQSVSLLPSGVTQLEISRTPEFKFHAGDYVYLRIPVIAKYEWHPFTISSAPEQEDTFWVHIRSAGHWTKKVHSYFLAHTMKDDTAVAEANERNRRASSIAWFARKTSVARARQNSIRRRAIKKQTNVKVFVDGPYGSACRSVLDTEHAILIGSGIGVTPFASILQSISFRFKAACVTCPECMHLFYTETLNGMKLKKVDFVWINRDQRNFEWFVSLLGTLEREQGQGLNRSLSMHMFMTGAPNRYQVQGVGVQVALDIVHNQKHTDLITGLNTRIQPGRPDIHKLLSEIKAKSGGLKMKVFMCGSPSLSKTIQTQCAELGIQFSKEQF